jgi:hypothetical protein
MDRGITTHTSERLRALFYPAVLALIWATMAALIRPVGDFPLNDDWSYGRIVRTLIETGRLDYGPWVSMALVVQVLWGALFCLPFGFSHTALRFSTLTLGLAGALGTYLLLRECGAKRSVAFLGALTVAANPVYFCLSATFLTDVPFFAFAVFSTWLLVRTLRRGIGPSAVVGIFLLCCATLIREVGLIVAIAFVLTCFYRLRIGISKTSDVQSGAPNPQSAILRLAVCALLFPLACHLLFHAWLAHRGLPALYSMPRNQLFQALRSPKAPLSAAKWSTTQIITVALYLLPFVVARFPFLLGLRGRTPSSSLCSRRVSLRWVGAWAVLLGMAVTLSALRGGTITIKPGNILYDFGLGPGLLRDVYCLGLPHLPTGPHVMWLALTAAAVCTGGVLVQVVLRTATSICAAGLRLVSPDRGTPSPEVVFVLAASTGFFLIFAPTQAFDRYYLMQLPLLMGVASSLVFSGAKPEGGEEQTGDLRLEAGGTEAGKRLSSDSQSSVLKSQASSLKPQTLVLPATFLLLLYGLFAVMGTRDYLEWNRVKWRALDDLTQTEKIAPRDIDGGFEFNGLYVYDPATCSTDPRFWAKDDAPYILAFGPIPNYEEWKRYPYRRLLPPSGEGHILVLRRVLAATPSK